MSLKCINLRRGHELFLVICVISIAFVVAKLFYSSSEKGLPFKFDGILILVSFIFLYKD